MQLMMCRNNKTPDSEVWHENTQLQVILFGIGNENPAICQVLASHFDNNSSANTRHERTCMQPGACSAALATRMFITADHAFIFLID